MKIHNRQSYLTSQSEGKAENRKFPKLTQLIYMLLLIFLICYLIYFFVNKAIYIKDIGFVEIQKTNVSSEQGGKIESLHVEQGDEFVKGDVLAILSASKTCLPADDTKKLNVSLDIDEEVIVLEGMKSSLALLKQIQQQHEEQENNGVRRALELNASLTTNRFNNLEDQLELKNEIALQQAKIENLRKRLASLNRIPDVHKLDPACSKETIQAPFDGKVFALKRQANEVVTRGEEILLMVANDAEVYIEVYLDIDLYDSVMEQSSFLVIFPNGVESMANIEEVNSSAYSTPDREWDDYQPVVPSIRVKLTPSNQSETDLWKSFDRYQVEIRGMK